MSDLFGFATPLAPARKKSAPESRITQTAPPVAARPEFGVSDSGEPAGKVSESPQDSQDDLRPAPARRATWPRTMPTAAHLAEHVLVVLDHLRAANIIPPPPVPYG
jgi:hypothetical protein